jgi:hypothetical protein
MILGRVWGVEAVRSRPNLSSPGSGWQSACQTPPQVKALFWLVVAGAPSRIRTCAHGSGEP